MISEETDNRPNPDHEGYDHVCPVCDQGYYGSYCEYCAELADAETPTSQGPFTISEQATVKREEDM